MKYGWSKLISIFEFFREQTVLHLTGQVGRWRECTAIMENMTGVGPVVLMWLYEFCETYFDSQTLVLLLTEL